MGRLLAVLAMAGGLVVLIVGSLSFLPGRTDAAPVLNTNLLCTVNGTDGPRTVRKTLILNGANTYSIPATATGGTDLRTVVPIIVRNETTGAFGTGVIQQIDASGNFNMQIQENPVVPGFPFLVSISTTLNVNTLGFSGQLFDYQLGGSLFSGSSSGTITGCTDIDP